MHAKPERVDTALKPQGPAEDVGLAAGVEGAGVKKGGMWSLPPSMPCDVGAGTDGVARGVAVAVAVGVEVGEARGEGPGVAVEVEVGPAVDARVDRVVGEDPGATVEDGVAAGVGAGSGAGVGVEAASAGEWSPGGFSDQWLCRWIKCYLSKREGGRALPALKLIDPA